ncbi:hypothetical protein ACIA8O_34900 [Kitasatospora sp. NPDC051853]|uniref:SCO2583/SCO2584 N-terminal domain-containing protein n=1 Tax=Kitasatospora sp. NPDC051853 TaxID=3364058 RepID=UPI0037998DDE
MPIADEPEPRSADDPSEKDPFEGLVLDEAFVRAATVKEASGRTRMLAARWKHTPPHDPGGRRSVNDGPKAARRKSGSGARKGIRRGTGGAGASWQTWLIVVAVCAIVLFSLKVAADTMREPSAPVTPQPRPTPTAPADPTAPAQDVPKPV